MSLLASIFNSSKADLLARKILSGKKVAVQETVIVLLQPFLLYFINRLYFSMCVGSLRN